MSKGSIGLSEELNAYLIEMGARESEGLGHLREETAVMPQAGMQIAVEQGALLAMLVKLLNARKLLEVGTFTGYSSTAMALALPPDGHIVCCDVSKEFTDVARRAGVLRSALRLFVRQNPWSGIRLRHNVPPRGMHMTNALRRDAP